MKMKADLKRKLSCFAAKSTEKMPLKKIKIKLKEKYKKICGIATKEADLLNFFTVLQIIFPLENHILLPKTIF